MATLCLQLVSPSMQNVSTQATPLEFELFRRIISAGNLSPLLILTTWPTLMFFHFSLVRLPLCFQVTLWTTCSFYILSDTALALSSRQSLIMEMKITGRRPNNIVGYPSVMETCGTIWRTIMKRKYMFEGLENCSTRLRPMKFVRVYLVVLTSLLAYPFSSIFLSNILNSLFFVSKKSDLSAVSLPLESSLEIFYFPSFELTAK